MPEEVVNQISHLTNSMILTIVLTILLYFVAPLLGIIFVTRVVLRIRGIAFRIITYAALLGCGYLFTLKGLPEMQRIFSSMID